jgi:superfamily II DNA or RNA helicase
MAESPLFDPSELSDTDAKSDPKKNRSRDRGRKAEPKKPARGRAAAAVAEPRGTGNGKARASARRRGAAVVDEAPVANDREDDLGEDAESFPPLLSMDDGAMDDRDDRTDRDDDRGARARGSRDDAGYGGGSDEYDDGEGEEGEEDDGPDEGGYGASEGSSPGFRGPSDEALDPNDPRLEAIEDKSPIRAFATTLSDRAIQRITGGNAFLRGRIYARRGAVEGLALESGSASGTILVKNVDEPYRMRVAMEGDSRVVSECNCQGWRGPTGHCKHVAALLVALRDRERPPRPKGPESQGSYGNGGGNGGSNGHAGGNGSGGAGHAVQASASGFHMPQTVSVGGKRRRARRRRGRGELGAGYDVVVTRDFAPETSAEQARGSLDAWLASSPQQKPYAFEYRVLVRPAAITVTPVLAGTRSAVSIPDVLTAFGAVSSADRPLLRALNRSVNRGKPTMSELRGEDAAEFLAMLKGKRVLLEPASMELRFADEALKPRIELDATGEDSARARVVFELPSSGRRFSLSNGAWFEGTPGWYIDTVEGVARPITDSVTPAWLQRFYRSPSLVHPLSDLPYLLTDFVPRVANSIGAPLPELASVADLVDATPKFTLRTNGDIVDAHARILVGYKGEEFPVPSKGLPSPLAFLPPTSPGGRPRVVRRDVGGEMVAIQTMMNHGFVPDEYGHELVASGEKAIAFWTQGLAELPKDWEKFIPDDLVDVRLRGDNVTPQMRVSSGVDWLSLDMVFSSGGVAVDAGDLRACLESGRHIVKLSDGTYAPVKREQVGEILARLAEIEASGGSTDKISLAQAGRVQDLARLVDDAKVTAKAKTLFDRLDDVDEIESIPKPRNLKASLRDYQKKGFNWLVFIHNLASGGILADDMGLGKTLQTIALLCWAKQNMDESLPHLVVAPTSVVPNWQREVEKFAPGMRTLIWQGQRRHDKKDEFADVDIVITSYALLRRDEEFLSTQKLGYVILDEAQHIKNPASATAKSAKRLKSERRLALTGTPIENRLSEFWSILDFVSPGLLGDLRSFEEKVSRPIERGDVATAERLRNTIKPFVLRRTKRDVAPELPPKIEQEMIVPLADEQTVLYQQILGEIRKSLLSEIDKQGISKAQIQILAALTRLRQAACDPRLMKLNGEWNDDTSGKLGALREIMEEAVAGGHRVIVFSQFVEMLKIIRAAFDKDGVKYEYLDGSTKDRMERVDRFNKDESYGAFLISLKAGGTGLNLVGADTVVHFDPWWNPAVEDQATDRAHRIGQTKTVTVYRSSPRAPSRRRSSSSPARSASSWRAC